jgi:topoisomerase-4 subunit A
MFMHRQGRKLLLAATSGHGFVTNEDEAVALKRSGKQVMNVPAGTEAIVCTFVVGDHVAVVGENRKLLVFPLADVPELARGRGVILQRYRDGHLLDARVFTWKDGVKDQNNRNWTAAELKEWKGERAQAGRIVPRGFAKSGKFG